MMEFSTLRATSTLGGILLNHKIIEKEYKFDVRSEGEQTIIIMPEIVGTGTMLYNAHIDGPASQVVQINDVISIDEDGSILLRLNPDELLRPGMLARGDVVLIDNNGIESRLPFVLYTENAISDIPNRVVVDTLQWTFHSLGPPCFIFF